MPKKVTAWVGDEERALLKQVSEQEGVSQGAIITRALRGYFRARVRRARSIGAGRSGRKNFGGRAETLLTGFGEDA